MLVHLKASLETPTPPHLVTFPQKKVAGKVIVAVVIVGTWQFIVCNVKLPSFET